MDQQPSKFTVYLEGHEGHQGNVLVHAFLSKIHRLTLVLNKMERAFIDSSVRQTDFEITAADKRNPTTLTLKPVPRVKGYSPLPAIDWALHQLRTVADGGEPDSLVEYEIARDLVKLATKDADDGYKAFWINGHAQAVRFDDDFRLKADRLAQRRLKIKEPARWHEGKAQGTIVGQLKAVDDIDDEREFVIVPPVGAEAITCTFPASMRAQMGNYLFKNVRVRGTLYYGVESPFPYRVDATDDGISVVEQSKRNLSDLRGTFSGLPRGDVDWLRIVDA
jgi:hypothetical protein